MRLNWIARAALTSFEQLLVPVQPNHHRLHKRLEQRFEDWRNVKRTCGGTRATFDGHMRHCTACAAKPQFERFDKGQRSRSKDRRGDSWPAGFLATVCRGTLHSARFSVGDTTFRGNPAIVHPAHPN